MKRERERERKSADEEEESEREEMKRERERAKKVMLMKFIILNFILHNSLVWNFPFRKCDFRCPNSNIWLLLHVWIKRLTSICTHVYVEWSLIQFHSGFYSTNAFMCINLKLAHKFKLSSHRTQAKSHSTIAIAVVYMFISITISMYAHCPS